MQQTLIPVTRFLHENDFKENYTRLLKKIRKFTAGFLRPKNLNKSNNFRILIFTQEYHLFYLIWADFLCYSMCSSQA